MPSLHEQREKNIQLVAYAAEGDVACARESLLRGANIHYADDLALRGAIYLGHTDMIKMLLDEGANVHADGETPLFVAVKQRDHALIDLLLEKGASLETLLYQKKEYLADDPETRDFITTLQSRDIKAAFEKNYAALREKAKARPPFKIKRQP